MLFCSLTAIAQEPAEDAASFLQQIPATAEQRAEYRQHVEERIATLRQAVESAEGVSEEQLDAQRTLLETYEELLAELDRAKALAEKLELLSKPDDVSLFAQEIAEVEVRTRAIRAAPSPSPVTDESIQEINELVQAADARVKTLSTRMADHMALLGGGFGQQREALLAQRKELESQANQLRVQPTVQPAAPAALDFLRKRARVAIARVDLALQNLQAEEQRVDLVRQRDQRLLAAWEERLSVVTERAAHLRSRHGKLQIRETEQALAEASDPVEQARLQLKLFAVRARFKYFDPPAAAPGAKEAQPAPREGVEAEIRTSEARWNRVETGLELHPSGTLRELRITLRDERAEWNARAAGMRRTRADVESEIVRVDSIRQRAQTRFDELAAELATLASQHALAPEELAQIESTTAAQRRQLREAAQRVIDRLREQAELLAHNLQLVTQHVQFLGAIDQAMRWKRLRSRDAGVLLVNWTDARAELRGAWHGLTGDPPLAAEPTGDLRLEDDAAHTSVRLRVYELRQALSSAVSQISRTQWFWIGASLIGAVALGVAAILIARRRGVAMARRIAEDWISVRESAEVGALYGVSARVDLLIWNMIGDLAIPVLATGAVAVAVWLLIPEPSPRRELLAMLAVFAGAALVIRLVHHLFEPESPPHRVIPCADHVARHYRSWLVTITTFTAILLPIPLALNLASTGAALREALVEVLKTGLLLMLLLFLLPRRRVLGELSAENQRWSSVLAFVLYPLVQTCVLALLVLELVGFGVLVSYVSQGILASLALLLLLTVVTGYINDAIEHRFSKEPPNRLPADAGSAWANQEVARRYYFLSLLRALMTLAAIAAVCVGLVFVWDIPLDQEWVNWRSTGLAALAVVLAVIAERVTLAAFWTLRQTGRLPESTTRLFQRWARGLIVVISGLTLIAIAGWRVESLWTFVTTLLAMIAIGFVAVWSILSNLLATLVILIWKPFNVGEEIELLPEGLSGQVVDINFMYTILESDGGARTAVPNSLFAQKFIKRKGMRRGPVRSLAEQLEADEAIKP